MAHESSVRMTIEFIIDTQKALELPGFPGLRIDGVNDDLPVPGLDILSQDVIEQFTRIVRESFAPVDGRVLWRDYEISPCDDD